MLIHTLMLSVNLRIRSADHSFISLLSLDYKERYANGITISCPSIHPCMLPITTSESTDRFSWNSVWTLYN